MYPLGAPISKKGKKKFVADLKSRFSEKPEEAYLYIERWVNRIISKARLSYPAVEIF
jgi:hypothetical protein